MIVFSVESKVCVVLADALHLSIPAQGLPNGEAALQHPAAFQAMQPAGYGVSGVGKFVIFNQTALA